MKILGIDPGSARIGYGVISFTPDPQYKDCGLIEIKTGSLPERLLLISRQINLLIKHHNPTVMGVEEVFFSKNKTTAIAVAHARGVILLSAATTGIPVVECSPTQIKSTTAGYGSADKRAVAHMVQKTLRIEPVHGPDDITDALAIALTAGTIYKNLMRK